MKKKSFLYGMLPLMMAAVLCGVVSSCSSDDPLDGGKDNGVVDNNGGSDGNGINGENKGYIALWDGLIK